MPERTKGSRASWRTRRSTTARPAFPVNESSDRLRRLLAILPVAARMSAGRSEDVPIAELAKELGMDEKVVEADLRQIAERADDLPGASGADLQILLEDDRVYVWTTAEFGRPMRLTHGEMTALGIGLRLARLDPAGGADRAGEALLERLEAHLAAGTPDGAPSAPSEVAASVETPDLGPDPATVRETLAEAIQERRPCAIEFLKDGAGAPERRRIHPYLLVHAEGWWYVLGYCEKAGECRSFRLDRILDAGPEDASFHEEATFEPADFVQDGRVFRAREPVEVMVRYAPAVARRIAETESGDWEPDGGYLVRRPVADPGWIVRHVLAFGGEAEVVGPKEIRALVRDAATALVSPPRDDLSEGLAPVRPT